MKMTTSRKQSLGFTLMELLTVMTILALLSSVGLVGYRHSTRLARESVLKENLFQLNHACEQHRADKGKYPPSLQNLVSAGYLRSIPVDPITKSKDMWVTEVEDADPNAADAEPGIIRVRSGSTEVSEDGTPYSEW